MTPYLQAAQGSPQLAANSPTRVTPSDVDNWHMAATSGWEVDLVRHTDKNLAYISPVARVFAGAASACSNHFG